MLSIRQSLFWMLVDLAVVAVFCVLPIVPLRSAFTANGGFDGVILGVRAVGILINLRPVLTLDTEIRWIRVCRAGRPGISVPPALRLREPLAAPLNKCRRERFRLSALALRIVLDGLREISRYLSRFSSGPGWTLPVVCGLNHTRPRVNDGVCTDQ